MTSIDDTATEAPNMKIRPPLVLAFAIVAGFALDHLLPLPVIVPPGSGAPHILLPTVLIALGCALAFSGIRSFAKAQTPVRGNQHSVNLVTTGIHAWSRNPIYLGMIILYLGIGVAVRSSWMLALSPAILLLMRFAVIAKEERYLEARFGEDYRTYKASVRRWL